MALFTNRADAKRPLLTKVCQLDLSNLGEVAALANEEETGRGITDNLSYFPMLILFHAGLPWPEMLDEFTPAPKPGEYDEEKTKESAKFYTEYLLVRLNLIQRVMDNIGRDNKILGSDIKFINGYKSRNMTIGWDDFTKDDQYYDLNEVGLYDNGHEADGFTDRLMSDLKKIVVETFSPSPPLRRQKKPIGICPECDKPFVLAGAAGVRRGSAKDAPRYCSYRCDHRAQGRERYNALFSDRKTL